jgi:hypothetical protein
MQAEQTQQLLWVGSEQLPRVMLHLVLASAHEEWTGCCWVQYGVKHCGCPPPRRLHRELHQRKLACFLMVEGLFPSW